MGAWEFELWLKTTGLNGRQAAELLGKDLDTVSGYRNRGVPRAQAKLVRLACAAIAARLAPWEPSDALKF